MAQVSGSGPEALMRLQTTNSQGYSWLGLENLFLNPLMWPLAGKFSYTPYGSLLSITYGLLAHSLQTE